MFIFVGKGYLDGIKNEVNFVLCGQFGKREIIARSTMLSYLSTCFLVIINWDTI
jgi:hypothetical protein